MAENPIKTPLPADLPETWQYGETIAPSGADAGLSAQHGYNYLMQQVNKAQEAVNTIGTAFEGLPSLGEDGKIPASQLPSMDYLPLAGGTMEGAVDMGGQKLSGLPEPAADTDAVTKSYADTIVKSRSETVQGTYPAYNKIAAGDVVDVVDGMVRHEERAANPTLVSIVPYRIDGICMLSSETGVIATISGNDCVIGVYSVSKADPPVSTAMTSTITNATYVSSNSKLAIAPLTSTSFIVVAAANSSYIAYVCTVDGDSVQTGQITEVFEAPSPQAFDALTLIRLSETRVLAVFGLYNYNNLRAQVLDISGTTITPGTVGQMPVDSTIGSGNVKQVTASLISGGNTGRVLVVARNNSNYVFGVVVSTNAAGNITFGAPKVIWSGGDVSTALYCCATETTGVVGYSTSNSNALKMYGCSISGNTLSLSSETALLDTYTITSSAFVRFGDQIFLLFSDEGQVVRVASLQCSNVEVSALDIVDVGARFYPGFCTQIDSTRMFVSGAPISGSQCAATTLEMNSVNGQFAGRWVPQSTQAIALNDAEINDACTILFSGTAAAPGLTAGTNITSDGVQGYVPQDGVLAAFPWWDYQRVSTVTGTYTGDDAETRTIDLGFQPRAVLVMDEAGAAGVHSGSHPSVFGGLALRGKPVKSDNVTIIEIFESGFKVYRPSGYGYSRANDSGTVHNYIAFR